MIDLKGKRALVCGGTSGIGKATVNALRENGADVVILSRSASGSGNISCDLEDLDSLKSLVTEEIEANGPFHILVNNSGCFLGEPPWIDTMPIDKESVSYTHLTLPTKRIV